jgi:hypothetical protein
MCKKLTTLLLLAGLLGGCVSVNLPGVVADSTQAGKDAYKALTARKDAAAAPPAAPTASATLPAGDYIVNAYIGRDDQTVAEIKDACVQEALHKIARLADRISGHTVLENSIALHNGLIVANCKVAYVR